MNWRDESYWVNPLVKRFQSTNQWIIQHQFHEIHSTQLHFFSPLRDGFVRRVSPVETSRGPWPQQVADSEKSGVPSGGDHMEFQNSGQTPFFWEGVFNTGENYTIYYP